MTAEPGAWARRTRAEQGLPPEIEDGATLARIAQILRRDEARGTIPEPRIEPSSVGRRARSA